MVSKLAEEDIEALIEEGCTIHPSDVIRLNALGLKIQKMPNLVLSALPRVAVLGDVVLRQPTIAQDIFLDDAKEILRNDPATILALETYVLAHPDETFTKLKHPFFFSLKCKAWMKRKLGNQIASEVRRAVDFCLYGVDQRTGEYPVYMSDKKEELILPDSELSSSLRLWLTATNMGMDSAATLRATSPQLEAMIERAWILNKLGSCSDDEKQLTAEYFATLDEIKRKAHAERDNKNNQKVTNG